jgi:hypothetical protein
MPKAGHAIDPGEYQYHEGGEKQPAAAQAAHQPSPSGSSPGVIQPRLDLSSLPDQS